MYNVDYTRSTPCLPNKLETLYTGRVNSYANYVVMLLKSEMCIRAKSVVSTRLSRSPRIGDSDISVLKMI